MMQTTVSFECSVGPVRQSRRGLFAGLAMVALVFGACSGGGGGSSVVAGVGGSSPSLAAMEFGRLVDVYGFDAVGNVALFEADVLIGPDVVDEREATQSIPDPQIRYDFLNADPDTLQPRLLITRTIGTQAFRDLFDGLDDRVREVTPSVFGANTARTPFSVVPRNGAIRLTFSQDLGLTEDFFLERDPNTGQVTGQSNTEAVQVLEIIGDPNDENPVGDFRVLPVRVVPRGNKLIVDPVLLGNEGLQYQTANRATGLPESPGQVAANIRIAVALEGPLAIPGISADRVGGLIGLNNSGQQSVIRDFRSGNRNDTTPEMSRGFVRDGLKPRVVGQILMYLERVDDIDANTQELTFYKAGVRHEIDRGDVVRLVVDNFGIPAAITEVVVDPADDNGQPLVQHVRVTVRKQFREQDGQQIDIFEEWDPSEPGQDNTFWNERPGTPAYPGDLGLREIWLKQYAPRLVLVAEFAAKNIDLTTGVVIDDDPRYFVTFTPAPLPDENGVLGDPNENVSPFAGAIVRFTKPVDLPTVRSLDTFFFATRDLINVAERDAFISQINIERSRFVEAKYVTPHLVAASVFDEDGSQTNLRLQPPFGFYLDDAVRQDEGEAFDDKKYKYFMHLIGGTGGIKDLAGNPIDFQSPGALVDRIVFPFSLDTRVDSVGQELFPDNLAISVARRFADADEDEQPSYYISSEIQQPLQTNVNALAFNLQDVFGPVTYLADGTLQARPTSRVTQVVDNINQVQPPDQTSVGRFCPEQFGAQPQVVQATAATKFTSPLQNPLNPNGCRLQTIWREIDMSLSRVEPLDFNLDVEQMYWAPFSEVPTTFDQFDQVSLFFGHSEHRTEPCIDGTFSLPSMPTSGLLPFFFRNYLNNLDVAGNVEERVFRHTAYVDEELVILPSQEILEPNGVNRFLPLPEFEEPYFVWRDERLMMQGGSSGEGGDNRGENVGNNYAPYILSPFLTGRGRYVTRAGEGSGTLRFNQGAWDNRGNVSLRRGSRDNGTGGLVGSIALPLMADFWTLPDSAQLPLGNPFLASGINGWQISLAVTSSFQPHFRALSAGGILSSGAAETVAPGSGAWGAAIGGIRLDGTASNGRDNSVYWIMADYVKRMSVVTAGFVDILNPHRMPAVTPDERLGPYLNGQLALPSDMRPRYAWNIEPPLSSLPAGTRINVEFRGAGPVDDLSVDLPTGNQGPWAAIVNQYLPGNGHEIPNRVNFPLDPLKAGDAHIRKFDARLLNGKPRDTWTYYYNRNITDYTPEPNDLADDRWTDQFSGPNEAFLGSDVTYFNWRFIFENNVDANPPTTPTIDSFSVSYRLEKTQ